MMPCLLQLDSHEQTNPVDSDFTSLCGAVASGNLVPVEAAVRQGAIVNITDSDGQLPLVVAAAAGHLQVM